MYCAYINGNMCHLKIRIEEHLGKDKNSQILNHLEENTQCRQFSNFDCFDVIGHDNSYFRSELKDVMRLT